MNGGNKNAARSRASPFDTAGAPCLNIANAIVRDPCSAVTPLELSEMLDPSRPLTGSVKKTKATVVGPHEAQIQIACRNSGGNLSPRLQHRSINRRVLSGR